MEYVVVHLMAFASAAFAGLAHLLVMRARPVPSRMMRMLALAFAAGFLGYVLACVATEAPVKAALAGAFLFGFLTLGYMELMFKTYRGFSHTLLTDVHRLGEVTVEDILREFAEGTGKEEMLARRLRTMEQAGLIRREEDRWTLLPSAERGAKFGVLFKNTFRLGKGG